MRQPPDEFSALLRRLRKAKGWSAVALSKAVNRSHTYIGIWERDSSVVPRRDVLLKVAAKLSLPEPERRQLLKLADLRAADNGISRPCASTADVLANVRQALSEVESSVPLHLSASVLDEATDASAWLLSYYATRTIESLRFESLAWPRFLAERKIICLDRAGDMVLPAGLIQEELPGLDAIDDLVREVVHRLGAGMAAIYRRWLLGDMERCRAVVSPLKRWTLGQSSSGAFDISVVFQDVDDDKMFGVSGSSVETVRNVAQHILRSYLWTAHNLEPTGAFREYPPRPTDLDPLAPAVLFANRMLANARNDGRELDPASRREVELIKQHTAHLDVADLSMVDIGAFGIGEEDVKGSVSAAIRASHMARLSELHAAFGRMQQLIQRDPPLDTGPLREAPRPTRKRRKSTRKKTAKRKGKKR